MLFRSYHRLKELANPVLVSLEYALRRYAPGDEWTAAVWAINDWPRALPRCHIEIGFGGQRKIFEVDLRPDSAEVISQVTWRLPAARGDWRIACKLAQGDQVLSTNRYDLNEYDGRRPGWRM